MLRRDLATIVFATAAGSTLLSRTAAAQSCTLPCYPQTVAEGASPAITPTDLSYPPGDVRRYGGVGDGVADDTSAIQKAHDQANRAGGARPYLPPGSWKITSSINPCQLGMYGDGARASAIKCSGCHAFNIPSTAGWDRPAPVFEQFSIDSLSNSCDDKFAFYFPGVAAGAAAIYNSGFTVRDVEIGRFGRMGGGFRLKDVFRATVENVGLTDVSRMIQIVGSVVQCSFRNVRSNNDLPGTALDRHGITTETASYSSGVGVCENITFTDCAYIRGVRGISHGAGAHVEFNNIDLETSSYGAVINAECNMRGGIVACSPGTSDWIGIFRGVNIPVSYDGTVFDGVDINTLNAPSAPAQSYGFELGDGVSPIHGVVIRNCRIRGTPGSMADGIRGRIVQDATIEDNFFETACFVGTPINIYGRRLFVNRNRIPAGNIVIQDGGDVTACGQIEYNQCANLIVTVTSSTRWTVRNF